MARIRTIKPEFFSSEDIISLSPIARLLYIALWCEADREGRFTWKPNTFKFRYLAGDNCEILEICAELIKIGVVVLYGDGLAFIPQFSKHQHVNPREAKSAHPSPVQAPCNSGIDASNLDEHAQVGKERKGKEGKDNSVPNGTGVKTPMSPDEIIFSYGLGMLTSAGIADKQARSFLGGLRKSHGDDILINALRDCARAKPLQPLEWLAAALPPELRVVQKNKEEPLSFAEKDRQAAVKRWEEMTGEIHPENISSKKIIDITPSQERIPL